ncbi:MAG: PorV/PorQ family protein, partial [Bacteroidales bacterium]|nr:PorV/PorQ family protein [Bacteroidales bacterium]
MKSTITGKFVLLFMAVISFSLQSISQNYYEQLLGENKINTITTSVPFLMIAPDARSGAIGDAGAASSPDVYSQHWNPAKYAFMKKNMGIAISYSPWLSKLVDDINLAYLNYYMKLNDRSAFSASLIYFSLGEIQFTNALGQPLGSFA